MADENTAIPDGYNIAWPTGYLIVRVSPEDESAFHERIEAWRAAEARLAVVERERDEARAALTSVRDAIVRADPYVLTCTLWMPDSMSETVVDFIDAALPTPEATK
jgi:hypothetical protein